MSEIVTVRVPSEAHGFFTGALGWAPADFEDLLLDALWSVLDAECPQDPRALGVKLALEEARKKLAEPKEGEP